MGKPFSVDSLEQIPEADRGLYVERGGKFYVDLEGAPDPAELERLRRHSEKLLGDLKRAKESGSLTAEEKTLLETLKAEKEEREAAELVKKGEFEKRLQQVQEAGKKRETAAEEKARKYRERLVGTALQVRAQSAFKATGGDAEILMPHLERDVEAIENEQTGEIEFRIREKPGSPTPHKFNAAGAPMSIDEYVELELKKRFPRAFDIPAASGSGALGTSGATSGAGGAGAKLDANAVEALDFETYRAQRAAGKIK